MPHFCTVNHTIEPGNSKARADFYLPLCWFAASTYIILYHICVCIQKYMFDIDSHSCVSLLVSHLFESVWAILVLGSVFGGNFGGILENCP